MSTPYVLLQACTTFISALNPVVLKHYRLRINETLVIYATLCISDFGNVDFVENENSTAVDTGQLELF